MDRKIIVLLKLPFEKNYNNKPKRKECLIYSKINLYRTAMNNINDNLNTGKDLKISLVQLTRRPKRWAAKSTASSQQSTAAEEPHTIDLSKQKAPNQALQVPSQVLLVRPALQVPNQVLLVLQDPNQVLLRLQVPLDPFF